MKKIVRKPVSKPKSGKTPEPVEKISHQPVKKTIVKPSFDVQINPAWCKRCMICVEVCPKAVFAQAHKTHAGIVREIPVWVARKEECTGCLECELMCPDLAIRVEEKK